MGSKMLHQAAKFIRDRRFTRRWIAFVLCLAVVVIVGTFWGLSKQGKALDNLVCGREEHVHTEACYQDQSVLVCGMEAHTHGDTCYDENGELICPLEEHQHEGNCCGKEEHTHTEECYETAAPADNSGSLIQEEGAGNPQDTPAQDGDTDIPQDIPPTVEEDGGDMQDIPQINKDDVDFLQDPTDENGVGSPEEQTPSVVVSEDSETVSGNDEEKPEGLYSSDLKDFITGVTMVEKGTGKTYEYKNGKWYGRDEEGKPVVINSLEINAGAKYKLKFSFAENNEYGENYKQFERDEEGNLIYDIPEIFHGIVIKDEPLYDTTTDTRVGTYSLDANGRLTVKYDEGYIEDYENVRLDIEIEALVDSSLTEIENPIEFGDDVKIDVILINETEIGVEKTAGSYNQQTHTIGYGVKVDVKKGTVNELFIDDVANISASDGQNIPFTLVPDSVSVKDAEGNSLNLNTILVVNESDDSGTANEPDVNETSREPEPILDKNNNKITLQDLINAKKENRVITGKNGEQITLDNLESIGSLCVVGPFRAGDEVLLTYDIKIDDTFYDSAYVSGTAVNTVTVEGTTDGEPVTGEDTVWKDFKNTSLTKTGELINMDGKKYVKWSVIVGDGYKDFTGKWVIDELNGNSMTYVKDKKLPVTVIPLDANGKDLTEDKDHKNKSVKCEWENGDNFVSPYPGSTAGDSFGVKLPTKDQVTDDCKGFKITYYTQYTGTLNYNDNQVRIEGTDIEAGGQGLPGIVKEVVHENTNSNHIEYKIEVKVPAGMAGNKFYMHDTLFTLLSANDWVNNVELVENRPIIRDITAVTESGMTITFTEGYGDDTYHYIDQGEFSNDGSYNGFFIGFNMTENDADSTHWKINESSTLTVTYQIPTTALTGTEWSEKSDKKLSELLDEKKLLINQVRLYYNAMDKYVEAMAPYEKPVGLDKNAKLAEDGSIEYTVFFDNGGKTEAAMLPNSVTEFVLTDDFDPRMEYVEGTLQAEVVYKQYGNPIVVYNYKGSPIVDGHIIKATAQNFVWNTIIDKGFETAIENDYPNLFKVVSDGGINGNIAINFTYKLKVKEEELKDEINNTQVSTIDLTNTAEVSWKYNTSNGPDEDSSGKATETIKYKTGEIEKNATQINKSDRLKFEIKLNSKELNLAAKGNTYEVIDEMSPNLSLDWETISVKYYNKLLSPPGWEELKTYTADFDDENNTLTFIVPDQTYILITYEARIKKSTDDSISGNDSTGETETLENIQNTATLKGKYTYQDTVNEGYTIQYTKGGTSGSNVRFTLMKKNKDTKEKLPGVEFSLYTVNRLKGKTPPEGVAPTIQYNGKKLYYCGSYTTEDNGTVSIKGLSENQLYALVETATPGFKKLDPIYFYAYAQNAPESGEGDTVKNIENGAIFSVENIPTYFTLPKTGSTGIIKYTMGGFIMVIFGMMLTMLYKKVFKYRKEER